MPRNISIFMIALFGLLFVQVIIEEYFDVIEMFMGKSYTRGGHGNHDPIKPKFLSSNIQSDEQILDYIIKKYKKIFVLRLYVDSYVQDLKSGRITVPPSAESKNNVTLVDVLQNMNYTVNSHKKLLDHFFEEGYEYSESIDSNLSFIE